MKSSLIPILIVTVVITAGVALYWDRQPVPSMPSASISGLVSGPANFTAVSPLTPAEPRNVSPNNNGSQPVPTLSSPASDLGLSGATTTYSRIVDRLISPQTSFSEKRALGYQLLATGGMDQAIAELKVRAANNPGDPEIPVTLGELDLGKIQTVQDPNAKGILALEADQYFNTALGIDPCRTGTHAFCAGVPPCPVGRRVEQRPRGDSTTVQSPGSAGNNGRPTAIRPDLRAVGR